MVEVLKPNEILKPGAVESTWRRGIGVWPERDVDLGFGALGISSCVVCFSSLSSSSSSLSRVLSRRHRLSFFVNFLFCCWVYLVALVFLLLIFLTISFFRL